MGDETLFTLKKIARTDALIKIISFRKNLGKSSALNQGFKKAQGNYIVTLDGDMQDGPENILFLINKLKNNYDLVKLNMAGPVFSQASLIF